MAGYPGQPVMVIDPAIETHYGTGYERSRLFPGGQPSLEYVRSMELLERLLPAPPARVLDAGGGPGTYAAPLARRGYEVHLVDPVPLHVDQDLADGQHRNPDPAGRPQFFTTAYFHTPDGLAGEIGQAGFTGMTVYGVEGPGWPLRQQWTDPRRRQHIVFAARSAETQPSLGTSFGPRERFSGNFEIGCGVTVPGGGDDARDWSQRYKANLEKLASGDLVQVVEVVRDLAEREASRGLSAGEKRMLAKARLILLQEG